MGILRPEQSSCQARRTSATATILCASASARRTPAVSRPQGGYCAGVLTNSDSWAMVPVMRYFAQNLALSMSPCLLAPTPPCASAPSQRASALPWPSTRRACCGRGATTAGVNLERVSPRLRCAMELQPFLCRLSFPTCRRCALRTRQPATVTRAPSRLR